MIMKKALLSLAVPALLLFAGKASAQSLQSSFFLDNYTYSYQLSPAALPDCLDGFFGFAIDNINLGANSNLGLGSVLFPVTIDGKQTLVTGLHSAVDADTFLNKLDDDNVIDLNAAVNVLSFGTRKDNKFYTFELNVRSDVSTDIPKDIFSLLKLGGTRDDRYVIKNTALNTTNYVELVGGYSNQLDNNWRLGGRVHLIAGIADASITVPEAIADVSGDLAIDASGTINLHAGKLKLPTTPDGYVDLDKDIKLNQLGIGGFGAAADFGAAYRSDKWMVDLSVLDLGAIYWSQGNVAEANYSGTVSIDDFDPATLFKVTDTADSKMLGLSPRINAGARYRIFPALSAGVLGTVRAGRYSWYETRAGLTYTPGSFFSIAATGGVNSYGPCFGAALNLNVACFNLYLGTDSIMTSFSPQLIPINKMHTRLTAGLVVSL